MWFISILMILLAPLPGVLAKYDPRLDGDYHNETTRLESSTCRKITWEGHTNGQSPLVEDCLEMLHVIADSTTWWNVLQTSARTIADHKSCHFTVQQHTDLLTFFRVNSWGVWEAVIKSIEQFAVDGRVEADGYWVCEGFDAVMNVPAYWSVHG